MIVLCIDSTHALINKWLTLMQMPSVKECLRRCLFIVPLLSLSDSLQEEIIHWVFRNEDRFFFMIQCLYIFITYIGNYMCDCGLRFCVHTQFLKSTISTRYFPPVTFSVYYYDDIIN